jgi:hypothetical protein
MTAYTGNNGMVIIPIMFAAKPQRKNLSNHSICQPIAIIQADIDKIMLDAVKVLKGAVINLRRMLIYALWL